VVSVKWEDDVLQDLQIMQIKSWKTCIRRKEQWKEIVELPRHIPGCRAVIEEEMVSVPASYRAVVLSRWVARL
jgi:hypothetical protein